MIIYTVYNVFSFVKDGFMKRITAIILCLCMIAAFLPEMRAEAIAVPVSTVKIGLSYGDNGVPAAKLQNVSGHSTGFKIGFYNASNSFWELYSTKESQITILKDKAMWITSSNDYYDAKPSSHKYYIGSYHLQLDESYADASSAMTLAGIFTAMGYQAFPAFINSKFRLRVGEFLTVDAATEALKKLTSSTGMNFNVVGNSTTCYTVTVTGTDRILFEIDSHSQPLGIQPNSKETWYNKYKYYGGFEFRRVYGNDLTVINIVKMNDYVKGVVPYEMSASWHAEALKAQAVCAKSYACNNLNKHKSMGFDLCNTTDCQVYYGTNQATAATDAAVEAVRGIYATYNGQIAMTYYHSNSGGHTEDVENIWGSYVPYLRGVEDIHLENPRPYSFTIDLKTISEILKLKGYTNQNVTDYFVSRTSRTGNVLEVTFTQADGSPLKLSGDRSRTALNNSSLGVSVSSHRFSITPVIGIYINKNLVQTGINSLHAIGGDGAVGALTATNHGNVKAITDKGIVSLSPSNISFTVSGTGSGHHIGMSQSGARSMANKGFNYEDILKFYFTGINITYLG